MFSEIQPGHPPQPGREEDAFYIGWMPKAPFSIADHVKKLLFILFPLALVIGLLIASFQKKFSTANFEFGKLTEVKGIYFNKPVPVIKVICGKDSWGNASFLTIPLVGYGKYGAETALMEIERQKNISLNQMELTLRGTLLYSDGKTLLQVNKDDNPLVSIGQKADASLTPRQKDMGVQIIKGEIVDPKCFFGVMKPGEGKVHRDCAIRCILGGIPPVLKVMNTKGEKNYYLIAGPAGEKMNKAVQDFVAEPVAITAKIIQQDDWIILYVNDYKSIQRISGSALARPDADLIACVAACSKQKISLNGLHNNARKQDEKDQ
ncbi:MAG: hypothetical protein ABI760_15210 [Ferruginibacter sp.]